jgi:hypothetical protein
MSENQVQISVNGKRLAVPVVRVGNFEIIVTGQLLKRASIRSEEFTEVDPAADTERLIAELRETGCNADFFTFAQRLPQIVPKYHYPMQWENIAAVSTGKYSDWWDELSQDTRRNVRLALKRGLVIRPTAFDDELVRGIMGIYNETPVRQGRKFWHYGKDFDTVKAENGTFVGRSQFIGAYLGDELVGFLKFVCVGQFASIMQILSKNLHQDKKPMNALVAKAVEITCEKCFTHLVYRQYLYHRADALTEFKRRNGFEQVLLPRYFVPLTAEGHVAVKLNLHRGIKEMLPGKIKRGLLDLRQMCKELIRHKPLAKDSAT